MDATRLQDLITGNDTQKLIDAIRAAKQHVFDESLVEQYNPRKHAIYSEQKRPKKKINRPDGGVDLIDVTRLSVPLQKKIVERAATFLAGNPIQLECSA